MMDVGLMPSNTGEPGGAIVGRNMSDYYEARRFYQSYGRTVNSCRI